MSANNPSPSLLLSLGLPNSTAPIISPRSSSPAPAPPPLHDDDHEDDPSLALTLALPTPRSSSSPLDDDDLLREILVRLPPNPSSLPRASLVSHRWHQLVSDPRFARRFRLRHRRSSPVLGLFTKNFRRAELAYVLTQGAPLPTGPFPRLRKYPNVREDFDLPGCRHGFLLVLRPYRNKFLVWDIISSREHRVDIPPGMEMQRRDMFPADPGSGEGRATITSITTISGAVLPATGDGDDGGHFKVVVAGTDETQNTRLLASVYSSETGVWGQVVSTPPPPEDAVPAGFLPGRSAVLLGDCLYWLLIYNLGILEFDLGRQTLSLIAAPVDMSSERINDIMVMPAAEGAGWLGFLVLTDIGTAQFWKRNMTDSASSWVLGTGIELGSNNLLPLAPAGTESGSRNFRIRVLGFAEESNVAVLLTPMGVFMVRLDSLQMGVSSWVKIQHQINPRSCYCPFEWVYTTAGRTIHGEQDGAERTSTQYIR